MSHTESVRPSSCASCGRAGRLPSIIIETMTEVVKPLNGYIPVKTLPKIQTLGKTVHPSTSNTGRGDTRTNLHHDHTKSENVCCWCGFISFLENLRRGPRLSISLYLRYENRVHPTNNRGKPEIRQTGLAVVVNENVGLARGCQSSLKRHGKITYPFQVSVYCIV